MPMIDRLHTSTYMFIWYINILYNKQYVCVIGSSSNNNSQKRNSFKVLLFTHVGYQSGHLQVNRTNRDVRPRTFLTCLEPSVVVLLRLTSIKVMANI